jgi:hypothetical protein
VISHGFNLHFLMISDVIYLWVICMSSFEKCLFKYFAHFNWVIWDVLLLLGFFVFWFFCYSVVAVPFIFWILVPCQIYDLKIFSPLPYVPFLLFCWLFLLVWRSLLVWIASSIYFCFWYLCFWYHMEGNFNREIWDIYI